MAYGSVPHIAAGARENVWRDAAQQVRGSGLSVLFDAKRRVLFMRLTHEHRYTFDAELLIAMRTVLDRVVDAEPSSRPSVVVIDSALRNVFSFGGDLEAFHGILRTRDEDVLSRYAAACIDVVHRTHRLCRAGIVSVANVSGDALGGGFELALSADFLAVAPDARLSLPERNFGSFPGMGAYSFLHRRVGRRQTERMILAGDAVSGQDAYDIGIADAVTEGGDIDPFLNGVLARPGTYLSVARARDEVSREELDRIVRDWVEQLLLASPRDRRRIETLARRQKRKRQAEAGSNGSAISIGSVSGLRSEPVRPAANPFRRGAGASD